MKTIENIKTETGNILIVEGDKGKLELLSIGDYGREKNVKADFLGLKKEINGVEHTDLLPLEEKWVITISSQYGCNMGCKFCDVPKVGKGINATLNDLINQVLIGIELHPEIIRTKRLNVHFARMGEPTWNMDVLSSTYYLGRILKNKNFGFHPVVSTMMPKNNKNLEKFIHQWMNIKNNFLNGGAGLQISINTTNDELRQKSMSYNTMNLIEISKILKHLRPKGRKIALNFALTDDEIDAEKLVKLFDPKYFMCKLTPIHMTNSCIENNIKTYEGYEKYYPYKEIEEKLKSVGFDVLVFVPSKEEEKGKITCGNAILSENTIK